MKIKHHVPTEQYGFTEYEMEAGETVSYEEARKLTQNLDTLRSTAFNEVLDGYVAEIKLDTMTPSEFEGLNPLQSALVQCIKRLNSRKNNDK